MTHKECIGLIGGLGLGATIHYYRELAISSQASGMSPNIVIAHASVARVFDFVQNQDRRGLAVYLVEFIRRLKSAGATIAVIPAITPHFALQELLAISPLPIIDVLATLKQVIEMRGIHRVALFGVRFVIQSELFGCLPNLTFVAPYPQEVEEIHSIYLEVTTKAEASEEQYQRLTGIASALVRREGVEAIVLAGTELSLIFNQDNTQFPVVDCTQLHLGAIKKFLGFNASSSMIDS